MRVIVLCPFVLAACGGPTSNDHGLPDLTLVNARIVDVAGVRTGTISIRDGVIIAIDAPPAGRIIDVGGRTVMPGLIDLHAHIGGSPGTFASPEEFHPSLYPDKLRAFLYWGVLACRSLCDDINQLPAIGDMPLSRRPWFYYAGPAFTAPDGHPSQLFRIEPGLRARAVVEVDDPGSAREHVRRIAALRPNIIKTVLQKMQKPSQRLDVNVLRAVVDEAHKHGLRVVCHVADKKDAMDALEAGVDGLEHPPAGFDTELRDRIVRQRVFWVPTLRVLKAYSELEAGNLDDVRDGIPRAIHWSLSNPGYVPIMFAGQKQAMQREFRNAMASVRLMKDHIDLIACGSDSGNPFTHFGLGAVEELELLVEAGLTPRQALQVGTFNSARHLGLAGPFGFGSVGVGKLAELLIVDGRPDERIGDLRKITAIVHGGSFIPREELSFGPQYRLPAVYVPGEHLDDWMGWRAVTDALWGGSSEITLLSEGGALHVRGKVARGFMPLVAIQRSLLRNGFQAAEVSQYSGVSLRIKGEGKFQLSVGLTPRKQAHKSFESTADWQEIRVTWKDLNLPDHRTIISLQVGPAGSPSSFEFWLADVRFFR